MKIDFIMELGKSYMTLTCGHKEDPFAVQMLKENHIRSLLPFEKRTFNGEMQFFYDVTGMCSLSGRVEKMPLGEKDIRRLLQGLYCVFEEIHSYFLKPEGLMLQAEYIYETQDAVFFCYCPSKDIEGLGATIEKFAEELLDQVDNEEEEALELVYRFYSLVKDAKKGVLYILEEVLTKENSILEAEEIQEQIPITEISVQMEEEEVSAKKERVKKTSPDVYTIVFFLSSFLVSLCYLFTIFFFSIHSLGMILMAGFMVVLSIAGMATGLTDIDIVRKK